jgi:hypothetical protein
MRAFGGLACVLSLVLSLAACGGSDNGSSEPSSEEIGEIAKAFSGIATGCLGPRPDPSAMTDDVDTLLSAYEEHGTDAEFKLAPNGPPVTMEKLLQDSRDQLRNCEAAGVLPNAGSLAGNIDARLNE